MDKELTDRFVGEFYHELLVTFGSAPMEKLFERVDLMRAGDEVWHRFHTKEEFRSWLVGHAISSVGDLLAEYGIEL